MTHKNLSILIVIMLVFGGLTTAMALAKGSAGQQTVPRITIAPKLAKMFPQEQVRLCVKATAHLNFRQLVWQRRPHQDSTLAGPAENSIRCRQYTAPTKTGWDRVTVRFKNQKEVAADWTITIVPAPANP